MQFRDSHAYIRSDERRHSYMGDLFQSTSLLPSVVLSMNDEPWLHLAESPRVLSLSGGARALLFHFEGINALPTLTIILPIVVNP